MTPFDYMSIELKKLAAKRKQQLTPEQKDALTEAGGALMAVGSFPARQGVGGALAETAMRGAESGADVKTTRKLLRASGQKYHFKPNAPDFAAHAQPKGMLPEFIKKKIKKDMKSSDPYIRSKAKKVWAQVREGVHLSGKGSAAPEIAAHEVGHMEIGGSRLGRMIQNLPTALALRATPAVGLTSGVVAGSASDPESERAARIAATVPLATAAPGMTYEGLAHVKGIKHMRRAGMGGGEIAKRLLRTGAPALGTYGLLPAAGAAAAYGGTKGVQAYRRRKKREKQEGAAGLRAQERALKKLRESGELVG